MTAERESMTLQEMDAPALGVAERRDEAPGGREPATRGQRRTRRVVAKPKRRKFTAQYRLRILERQRAARSPARWAGCFAARVCTAPI